MQGVNRPTMFFISTISQIIFVKGPLESNSILLMHYLEGIAQGEKKLMIYQHVDLSSKITIQHQFLKLLILFH